MVTASVSRSGGELERIQVREDDLLRGFRDARVDQHGVIAHQEILKKVPARKQGLDLIDVGIEFHAQLQLGDKSEY